MGSCNCSSCRRKRRHDRYQDSERGRGAHGGGGGHHREQRSGCGCPGEVCEGACVRTLYAWVQTPCGPALVNVLTPGFWAGAPFGGCAPGAFYPTGGVRPRGFVGGGCGGVGGCF